MKLKRVSYIILADGIRKQKSEPIFGILLEFLFLLFECCCLSLNRRIAPIRIEQKR